jgi:RND family efflux transporter MFP subunit
MLPTARLLTLPLLALIMAGCGKKDATPEAVGPVALPLAESSIAIATVRSIQPAFEHPGVIEAVQHANVKPEVAATISGIRFAAGDIVEKGQLLMELDPASYQARLDAAEAELQSAKANAEQAETNWQRAEGLKPKGYISALDFDKARATRDVAMANVAKAAAQLEQARLDMEHTQIKAPFSGRISKPRFAVGDYVTPAGPALFELVQLDPIYATASVGLENYNNYVILRTEMERKGMDLPEIELTLELVGGLQYPHTGKFENWSHSSSQSSGMITGRALFPNPDGLLLPGQNVTLVGKAMQKSERTMVPQAAVLQDQQGYYVMTLDDTDTVRRQNVQVGVRDGADWAVREGLEPGTRVIVAGAQTLRAGTKVAVQSNRQQ